MTGYFNSLFFLFRPRIFCSGIHLLFFERDGGGASLKTGSLRSRLLQTCAAILVPPAISSMPAVASSELQYINLDYPVAEANFTGIRGANIVGNDLIPGGGCASGGILYRTDTQTWVPIPTSTANGVNYPGVYTALPYGPTFGFQANLAWRF